MVHKMGLRSIGKYIGGVGEKWKILGKVTGEVVALMATKVFMHILFTDIF